MEILHKIPKLRWVPVRHWYDISNLMRLRTTVRDPADGKLYRFQCDAFESYQRARSFLGKEPETIEWLRNSLRPDDVFLDIGANIGIFSLFAAMHLDDNGHVYACEPHLPNATQVLQNAALNGLENRLSVLSIAASGEDGYFPFHYKRWGEGASGSQLAIEGNPALAATRSIGVEMKCGMTVDSMVEKGIIRRPNLIKIDTDGIEIPIVRGMERLLRSSERPRSLLIEIQPGEYDVQVDFMRSCGYALKENHFSGKPKRQFERGVPLRELAFNGLFEPTQ
ncbi:MAG: hypothetical protein RLZ98_394 [Pseudomonadota bacterium]|jgi:FkbM family methyltransferase